MKTKFSFALCKMRILTMFLAFALLCSKAWGDNILPKLYLSNKNTPQNSSGWTFTNATTNNANTDYWKMINNTSVVTSPSFDISGYTNVTVSIKWGSFSTFDESKCNATVKISTGSGTWTTLGTTGLTSANTSGKVCDFDNVENSSSYSNAQIQISTPNADGSVGGRLFSVEITGTVASSCSNKITINPTSFPAAATNGTFSLDKSGDLASCDGVTVTVTATPATNYVFSAITQSGVASGVTIDNSAKTVTYAANTTGTSTISVTFAEKTKYTVTWYVEGNDVSTEQVYTGNTATPPSDPTSTCDGIFVGWIKGPTSENAVVDKNPGDDYQTTPSTFTGTSPAITGNTSFYAVFKKRKE